jgi:hypothetical protein
MAGRARAVPVRMTIKRERKLRQVIAAMNVAADEVISQRIARNDSVTFVKFLLMLGQSIAPGLDRRAPEIRRDLYPEACVLTGKLLRRGDFTSREHLESQITEFTIRHNETAYPYKWSYDADADHVHQVTLIPSALLTAETGRVCRADRDEPSPGEHLL